MNSRYKLINSQAGDTLVEVLVATVVLTIILAGSYTVVNRATRINQSAVERSEIANQMTEQAELLRAMRDDHDGTPSSNWSNIVTFANASNVNTLNCSDNPQNDNAFYLSATPGTLGQPAAFAKALGNPLGAGNDAYPSDLFDVWIVAQTSPNDSVGSSLDDQLEFHIRGCWEGIGGDVDQQSELVFRVRE